jgi:hypothetical protein
MHDEKFLPHIPRKKDSTKRKEMCKHFGFLVFVRFCRLTLHVVYLMCISEPSVPPKLYAAVV